MLGRCRLTDRGRVQVEFAQHLSETLGTALGAHDADGALAPARALAQILRQLGEATRVVAGAARGCVPHPARLGRFLAGQLLQEQARP